MPAILRVEPSDRADRAHAGCAPPGADPNRGLRVCLAASGGGHLRQLLDLAPVWSRYDHFFLSEDTPLVRSIARDHPTFFVTHVALGQARLGRPLAMLLAAARNFIQAGRIILRERPDVLISTGAGTVFFGLLWARLLGAKVVVVESFARFHAPSAFGRIARPLAHRTVVQSAALAGCWPEAAVFDPLRILEGPAPAKEPVCFVTVGATLPFDRLVGMVAELKARGEIPERVIVQTGVGGARPAGVESVETLSFDDIQSRMTEAEIVICHGGSGSLITALRKGCKVVAVPRLFERGEVYDDHQAEITRAFADRGLVGVANSTEELSAALEAARGRPPILATTDPQGLIEHLEVMLEEWSRARKRRRPG
ncbi:MAG: beta-1,4-glucuronosyltransferase WelK [Caulobacteraceae bacterium]